MRFPFNLYREWNIETYEDIKRSRRFCFLLTILNAAAVLTIHSTFYLMNMSMPIKCIMYILYFMWMVSFCFSTAGLPTWLGAPTHKEVHGIPNNRLGEMRAFTIYAHGILNDWRDFLDRVITWSMRIVCIAFPVTLLLFLGVLR